MEDWADSNKKIPQDYKRNSIIDYFPLHQINIFKLFIPSIIWEKGPAMLKKT